MLPPDPSHPLFLESARGGFDPLKTAVSRRVFRKSSR